VWLFSFPVTSPRAIPVTVKRINGTRCYGYDWEKAREEFLTLHPICAMTGCGQPSTIVDHVTPHKGDPVLFWDTDNWQALCETCHNKHKQLKEKGKHSPACSQKGLPIDKDHPWNN